MLSENSDMQVSKNTRCNQRRRLGAISEFCERQQDLPKLVEVKRDRSPRDPEYMNVLLNERIKMLFTVIPKSASTTWRSILAAATGKVKPRGSHPNFHNIEKLNDVGITSLSDISTVDREKILKTYYKVLIVRNPFDRLISAFDDKFHHNFIYGDTRMALRYINETYRSISNHVVFGKAPNTTDVPVTEFLRLVLDENAPYNKHWDFQAKLSHICQIKYDYIIKVETMEDDSKPIFDRLLKDNATSLFLRRGNSHRATGEYDAYYNRWLKQMSEVPLNMADKLKEFFQVDMEAFGYGLKRDSDQQYYATCSYNDDKCC